MTAHVEIRKKGAIFRIWQSGTFDVRSLSWEKLSRKRAEGLTDGYLAHFGNCSGNRRTRGLKRKYQFGGENHEIQKIIWICVYFT